MSERVAVVTGGNRGIGLAISRQLAEQGVRVLMTGRNAETGAAAAANLRDQGHDVTFFAAEITDPQALRRLVKYIADQFGRVDILVNNAGIFIDRGSEAATVEMGMVRQTLEVNLFGPWQLCQYLLPLMQRQGYGRIVNMSSSMGSLAEMGPNSAAYRVSKTALNALTRVMALENQAHDILINTVSPGWVATDMGGPSAPRTPDEGADTAVWLATLPSGGPTGKFFRDRQEIAW